MEIYSPTDLSAPPIRNEGRPEETVVYEIGTDPATGAPVALLHDAPPERNANYSKERILHQKQRDLIQQQLSLHSQAGTKKETRTAMPQRESECTMTSVELNSANRRKLKRAYEEEMYVRGIPENKIKPVDDRLVYQGVDGRSVRERFNGGRFEIISENAFIRDRMNGTVAERTSLHERRMGPERTSREGLRTKALTRRIDPSEEDRLPFASGPSSDVLVKDSVYDAKTRPNAPLNTRTTAVETTRSGGEVIRSETDSITKRSDVYESRDNPSSRTSDLLVGTDFRSMQHERRTTARTDFGEQSRVNNLETDVEYGDGGRPHNDRRQKVKASDSYGAVVLPPWAMENLPTHHVIEKPINDKRQYKMPDLEGEERALNSDQFDLFNYNPAGGIDDSVTNKRWNDPAGAEALSDATLSRQLYQNRLSAKTYMAHGCLERDATINTLTTQEREPARSDQGPSLRTATDARNGQSREMPEVTNVAYGV